jgi:tetratricopeptide (TPR) repeat protein
MMLLSLVLGLALAVAPQTQDARAEAERLARSGSHAEALKRFQAIAAANPDDVEARLWIARLHTALGHPERAATVYESIVASQPQNVDARIALGRTLTELERFAEAADMLNLAEKQAPENTAVLAAQGYLHGAAGRGTLAEAYYLKALSLKPDDAEIRREYIEVNAERAHRLEATYEFEHRNDENPDSPGGLFVFNGRLSDTIRAFGAVHTLNKFDRTETRGGGGIELLPTSAFELRAGALFGGSDAIVVPEVDLSIDLEYESRTLTWIGGFRLLDFAETSTWIITPGLRIEPSKKLGFTFLYHFSDTEFSSTGSGQANSGVTAVADYRMTPRVLVDVSYLNGFEGHEIITREYATEQFDASALFGGFEFDATPMTSIRGRGGYEWRDFGARVASFSVTLIQRF